VKEKPMRVEQAPDLSSGAAKAATSYQRRHERGRATRRVVPRGSHAEWGPAPDRPDPVALLESYKRTLQEDRRHLLDRYRFVDAARKVVGVGSVGTRAYVVLLEGRDQDDPLFLQVKEAGASVLEGHVPSSTHEHHGHRVVAGQRLMQAASDIFIGWFRGRVERDYYWRQLKDMQGSADVASLSPDELVLYAGLCGWALARAHARSGDRVQIAAYLGKSERFDRAVADFAQAYADQNERDHTALCAAVKSGRVAADAVA